MSTSLHGPGFQALRCPRRQNHRRRWPVFPRRLSNFGGQCVRFVFVWSQLTGHLSPILEIGFQSGVHAMFGRELRADLQQLRQEAHPRPMRVGRMGMQYLQRRKTWASLMQEIGVDRRR